MHPRLLDAASTGNLLALNEMLQENPEILIHNVTLDNWDTPLHIASLLGYDGFVQMVLQLNPELAHEINQQGMSPLHLASAKGHLDVVKCFLAYDSSVCRLKNPDGLAPLHLAAIKGKVPVLIELFQSCPQVAMEPTNAGDTVLFLAVKNNQYPVLQTLVNQFTWLNRDDNNIYNAKDEEGNTILHYACKGKRWEMVKLLVTETNIGVNEVNSKGFTALDILITSCTSQSTTEQEIERTLGQAGGKQALVDSNSITAKIEKLIDSLKTGILIMASTFAALTFQAALNPPGGFWQDFTPGSNPKSYYPPPRNVKFSPTNLVFIPVKFWGIQLSYIPKVPSRDEHRPGKAMNRELDRVQFFAFLAYDAVCFMISILMIVMVAGIDVFPFSKSLAAGFLFVLMFSLVIFAGLLFRSGIALATDMQVSQWVIYGAFYNVVVGASIYLCVFAIGRFAWSLYKKRKIR